MSADNLYIYAIDISSRSGQFVSPYLTEASGLPQSSGTIGTSTMMGLPQQLTGAYYDPTQQMQAGMTHVSMPHTGDHHMTHSTRAHPQTVSLYSSIICH